MALTGLTAAEAEARLRAEGANDLPHEKPRGWLRSTMDALREPMFALLLASGAIYLVLGDLAESLLLLVFSCFSVGITVIQEHRSERVLDALRDLSSPLALVVRDAKRLRIPGKDIVRGDLLVLAEGDRIAADAVVREAADLSIDESLLTGESMPVRKRVLQDEIPQTATPGGEDTPFVYASTLVVRGGGLAEVTATGASSKVGLIGKALSNMESATPRLTLETRRIVRIMAAIGAICCLTAFLMAGIFRGSWLQALLSGLALSMALIPEEFPLVLTVFTAMGAWRLSQARVLTRRAAAIETLGAASILCTDKTGTLTENRMSIAQVRIDGEIFDCKQEPSPSPEILRVVQCGVLASAVEPLDPMEMAFHGLLVNWQGSSAPPAGARLAKAYPLGPALLAVTHVWTGFLENAYRVAAKGAPEAIVDLCRLAPPQAETVRRHVDDMAQSGMRVLGVAEAVHPLNALPSSPTGFSFRFIGLVGLRDPVRSNVPPALQECARAGIRVVMITGDYPQTARAIAIEAGLPVGELATGSQISRLDGPGLEALAGRANIFARIMPEQKLRLVQALQKHGAIVAMTGDGVNDAPALRAADIGVAMGGRGTDVAREAASIVLLDDDFASLVRTIKLGRRIYDNLRKAMGYIIAAHIPIAGMALLPLLTGWPLILGPVHVAMLEMIVDPACSLVFEAEPEETGSMERPPRPSDARLLSRELIMRGLVQGLVTFAFVALMYTIGVWVRLPEGELRSVTFAALVCGLLALVLSSRSFSVQVLSVLRGIGKAFWVIAASVGGGLILVLTIAPLRALFSFGEFQGRDILSVMLAAPLLLLLLEVFKKILPLRENSRARS